MPDKFNKTPTSYCNTWATLLVLVVSSSSTSLAQTVDSRVAPEEAVGILKQYCADCHHYGMMFPGLDVLDRDSLVKKLVADASATKDNMPFVTEGKPEESGIWKQIEQKTMPPKDEKAVPDQRERDLIRRWIEQGAEFPRKAHRTFISEEKVFEVILHDYQKLHSKIVQQDTRYFSLAHLWNDPKTSDQQLRIVRAALSKLLNSLSTAPEIVIPRAVDLDETVFAIRLSDYGWNNETWTEIAKESPYAITRSGDFALRVYKAIRNPLAYIRADWFISAASRPPLYHAILNLPGNAKDLERSLDISVQANFESGQIVRAAFKQSGVSKQNRMVERHEFPHSKGRGYYWKSYDISEKRGEAGNFLRRPLEPENLFQQGPVSFLSPFQHDGGEIIWSLPNGMQAYLLVKEDDQRIDVGPKEIVSDNMKHSGSDEIVNGISCMGCHTRGMVPIQIEEVRDQYEGKLGSKAAKVAQIYREKIELDQLLQADQDQFMAAVEHAVAPFLGDDEESGTISEGREPITQVAKEYRKDLRVADAIRELGSDAPDVANRVADSFGKSGRASRGEWERDFPKVNNQLGLGKPIVYP